MLNPDLFTAFLLITVVLFLTPGPIVTLLIATGATHGSRAALLTVIRTIAGNALLVGAKTHRLIPPRLNLDLFEVGVGGEGVEPTRFGREGVPGRAVGVHDGLVVSEQAMREVTLSQEEPDPLDRVEVG